MNNNSNLVEQGQTQYIPQELLVALDKLVQDHVNRPTLGKTVKSKLVTTTFLMSAGANYVKNLPRYFDKDGSYRKAREGGKEWADNIWDTCEIRHNELLESASRGTLLEDFNLLGEEDIAGTFAKLGVSRKETRKVLNQQLSPKVIVTEESIVEAVESKKGEKLVIA